MTTPGHRPPIADSSSQPTQRWQRRGYRETAVLALLASWAAPVWLVPEVPLPQLHYPFLVFGFCGIFCYRVLGAPRLVLRDRDLVSTGVFQTSTVPYDQITKIVTSNGITLHLRNGEEVFLEGMPTSLFQAITGDRRSARLRSVLEQRVADAPESALTRPRVRKTVRPFLGQVVLTAGVFVATYLVALLSWGSESPGSVTRASARRRVGLVASVAAVVLFIVAAVLADTAVTRGCFIAAALLMAAGRIWELRVRRRRGR